MSGLRDRLLRLHLAGHAHSPPGQLCDPRFAPDGEIRSAAVLIAVTDRAQPGVLLTHRPADMRQHPGQVAFPGGKLDPGEDAVTAALREMHEELGIAPAHIEIIGTTDRFVTGTGYDITPVLAVIPPDLAITPNPAEVADWFEAPFAHILDPANHARKKTMFDGQLRAYTEIMWQENRIWGVTAAIIENLARRLAWQEVIGG